MKVHYLGDSHAARHFRLAAEIRGLELSDIGEAEIIFVSEDTPTDEYGNRDLQPIKKLMEVALSYSQTVVLTSQVPPGFCRHYNTARLFHMSETLRIKDALLRAVFPEQIILGRLGDQFTVPDELFSYCKAFVSMKQVVFCSYETAEFSKIAINMTLASQVKNTNRLAAAAEKVGASWKHIQIILGNDKRIGPHSYLEPGEWKDSKHLLRDYVTLKAIENG